MKQISYMLMKLSVISYPFWFIMENFMYVLVTILIQVNFQLGFFVSDKVYVEETDKTIEEITNMNSTASVNTTSSESDSTLASSSVSSISVTKSDEDRFKF